jgi:hypothetical protein
VPVYVCSMKRRFKAKKMPMENYMIFIDEF